MSVKGRRDDPHPAEHSCSVVAQARVQGPVEIKVTVVGAAATRSGTEHIVIRYAGMIIYCEDRAAVEQLALAARIALERADLVFGPHEDEFTRAERRTRNSFDQRGQRPRSRTA